MQQLQMWSSSLRNSIDKGKPQQSIEHTYNVEIKNNNSQFQQKRCMSAQRPTRMQTPNNQVDCLKVEEILRARDPESQFASSLRMNKEEKEEQFAKHFSKVLNMNQRFFKHLEGNCKCGKCTCTRCKCRVRDLQSDYKRNNRSVYRADYQPKITDVEQPFLQDKNPYRNNSKIEMNTTQRTDFIPKIGVDPKKECGYLDRNSLTCGQQALDHNTVYKNNFNIKKITPNVLFTHEPIEYLRVPHDKIKQKIRSESNSKYRKPIEQLLPSQLTEEGKSFTFINFAHDRQKNLKPPISMDDKMSMLTTMKECFQGFQPEKTSNSQKLDSTNGKSRSTSSDPYNLEFVKTKNEWVHIFNNQHIPNHEGQFISTKAHNFFPKNLNQTCEGWNEPDDIDRLPRSAYMYSYA